MQLKNSPTGRDRACTRILNQLEGRRARDLVSRRVPVVGGRQAPPPSFHPLNPGPPSPPHHPRAARLWPPSPPAHFRHPSAARPGGRQSRSPTASSRGSPPTSRGAARLWRSRGLRPCQAGGTVPQGKRSVEGPRRAPKPPAAGGAPRGVGEGPAPRGLVGRRWPRRSSCCPSPERPSTALTWRSRRAWRCPATPGGKKKRKKAR